MITGLTVVYLLCFQIAAVPAIRRIVRRGSSADVSVLREVAILVGVSVQLAVMLLTNAAWQVWISPVVTGATVGVLLGVILWYRLRPAGGRHFFYSSVR